MMQITPKEKKKLERYFKAMMSVEVAAMKSFDTIDRARYFLQNHFQELNLMRIHILEEERCRILEFVKSKAKKKGDTKMLFILAKELERTIDLSMKNSSSYLPFDEATQFVKNELPDAPIQDLEAEIIDEDSSIKQ